MFIKMVTIFCLIISLFFIPIFGIGSVGNVSNSGLFPNNETNLSIPTYDGSGQAIHPDIYYNETGWNGYKYWMSMTPYTNTNAGVENPSIVVSNDGFSWTDYFIKNPIVPKPPYAYNSDPTLAFNSNTNTLNLYYRVVKNGFNMLKMKNTTDGLNWSNEYSSLQLPNHQLVSPAVVYNLTENKYFLWYVDTGVNGSDAKSTRIILRNSSDGLHWSDGQIANIVIPNRIIWHIDVTYIPELGEYWMVASAGVGIADNNNELYFAKSTDKLSWNTITRPLIGLGPGWDQGKIYRSTIKYINDKVRVWYSAKGSGKIWGTGYTEGTLIDLISNLPSKTGTSNIISGGYGEITPTTQTVTQTVAQTISTTPKNTVLPVKTKIPSATSPTIVKKKESSTSTTSNLFIAGTLIIVGIILLLIKFKK